MPTLLFIISSTCGGTGRMTLLYAKILQQAGYDCRLLITQWRDYGFKLKSFIPDNLPYDIMRYSSHIMNIRLLLYIYKVKPDCVFYSFTSKTSIVVLAKLLLPRLKIVYRECLPPPTHRKWEIKLGRKVFPYVDLVISQTKEMKSEITEYYHVPPDSIQVINNPIDKAFIRQHLEERFEFEHLDYVHFLAVGRVVGQKDFATLIKAFSIVQKHNPQSMLHIVGQYWPDEYKKELDRLIENLNLTEYVSFEGFQPNPYKYMAASDVFVLSSVYEGLPNVLLEAMYVGIPVVSTRCIPYIGQVIKEGVNGYSVPMGQPDELAEAMLKALTLHIKEKYVDVNHSEDKIIQQFSKIIVGK